MQPTEPPASLTPFELSLAAAHRLDPSPAARAVIDGRVFAAIATAADAPQGIPLCVGRAAPSTGHGRFAVGGWPRRLFGARSWRGRVATVLVAALVIGGAGRGLVSLYEGMVGSDGWRMAWDHAQVVGLSQTVDGYRVTLERAYADANQLMLAVSVHDDQHRDVTQVGAWFMTVTDEAGRTYEPSMGMSSPDGASAAANLAWYAIPPGVTPGAHTFHVNLPNVSVRDTSTPPPDPSDQTWYPWHDVAGPWSFDLTLDVAGGALARPDAAVSVGDTTVRLSEMRVSASAITATILVSGVDGTAWAPVGTFRHAGQSWSIMSARPAAGGASVDADGGTATASGPWTLQIDELVGLDGSRQVRLAGPWTLTFTMP